MQQWLADYLPTITTQFLQRAELAPRGRAARVAEAP